GHGCSGDGVNFGFPPGSCECPNNISMFRTVCYGAGYGGSNCLSRTNCAPFCDDCLVSTPCHIEIDYNTPCLSVERPCDSCPREDPAGTGGGGGPAPTQPETSRGGPISVTTGAMFLTHTDAVVGELSLSRSYNSARLSTDRSGPFGPGWNASLD